MNSASAKPAPSQPTPLSLNRDQGQNKLPAILKNLHQLAHIAQQPKICLTFDDGPDPAYTPIILDILAAHQVRANFFVIGSAAKRFPHLIHRMLDAGHLVGNHTYSHHHPWFISARRARLEIARTSRVLQRITGAAPQWFRPPHGRLRPAMTAEAAAQQMTTVLWSRSAIDWGPLGTLEGVQQRLNDVAAGDIVLMHDGQREHNHPDITAQNLPRFFEGLHERGIAAITLDQAKYGC